MNSPIEDLYRRLALAPDDAPVALALISALRRRNLDAEARQVALEACARFAEDLQRDDARALRRALWSLPWAGAANRRPWRCVLRAPLTRAPLLSASGVCLPDTPAGDPVVGLLHRDVVHVSALDLTTGDAPTTRDLSKILRAKPPLDTLRRSPWAALERRVGGLWHSVALSPDASRLAALHDRLGLLVYTRTDDPLGAADLTPTLHVEDSLWMSGRALLSADASRALYMDPWIAPGSQRWTWADLTATPYTARAWTSNHKTLRGWSASDDLSTLALWTEAGDLLIHAISGGDDVARFSLGAAPLQVVLAPAARWLCCAGLPEARAWVLA
jgi:hypothetical protein